MNLPDVRGREAILKVHAKNVKLAPAVDLSVIARGTPGYSGAELANLLERSRAAGRQREQEGRRTWRNWRRRATRCAGAANAAAWP